LPALARGPRHLFQALDLGAIRFPGAHQHADVPEQTDAAIVRVKENRHFVAMSLDGNGRYT
jgi:hypothetical protein